MAVPKKRKK